MKPIKIYSDSIDGKALSQFHDAMKMDFAVQGALMPDAHAGYALPIGAVVATEGVIVPSWIGYDIGCGMCALPTTFNPADVREHAKAIFDQIYRDVPVGFDHNKVTAGFSYDGPVSDFTRELIHSGAPGKQLGTLGGGNHFIEIGEDTNGTVWIIIHSGSRNVGHKIATHYMKVASNSDKAKEWHYALNESSDAGQDYINDLAFGLQFALDNRKLIALRVIDAMRRHIAGTGSPDSLINRNHNHAEKRVMAIPGARGLHTVWIHRKGATHADLDMPGVIPGNMRDGTFIVRGKGNPDSLYSSSHGAGRVLGRAEAKRQLDLESFKKTMLCHKVTARVEDETLDEAPEAYKDIFTVMAEQADLVEVVTHVRPIINIKG